MKCNIYIKAYGDTVTYIPRGCKKEGCLVLLSLPTSQKTTRKPGTIEEKGVCYSVTYPLLHLGALELVTQSKSYLRNIQNSFNYTQGPTSHM